MEINRLNNNANQLPVLSENQERNKFVCKFNWLDTKFKITEDNYDRIKKLDLQKYVITNYFDYRC
jgi:hypothetical protein